MADINFGVGSINKKLKDMGDGTYAEVVSVTSSRLSQSVTIANGASVSATIDLSLTAILAVIMPSAWTAAALTIEVSPDGANWFGLAYDDTGAQCNVVAAPAVSSAYALSALGLLPYKFARLRSGTTATPVNQGADRAITVITRPLA